MPELYLIDAFTAEPFRGNPAGVCWLDAPAPDEWMQAVAAEMNQAETAFLTPKDGIMGLRWFTPALEVDLCGHATLASAHFLWETGRLAPDAMARFETRSGVLTARRDGGRILLDFPASPPAPVEPPAGLFQALGSGPAPVWSNQLRQPDYLVRLDSADAVRRLAPDIAAIGRLPVRGVIVTAPGDEAGVDFVSRFFAPRAGVDEDPVTGSAHCTLAPFWAAETGRSAMTGYQASRRGGTVGVRLSAGRVELAGQAVTVLRGAIG